MRSTSVGVRELRQNASALLRRVANGQTIRITDRGNAVAILGPLPRKTRDVLAWLRDQGEISFEGGRLVDIGEPLEVRGKSPASRALKKLRASER